MKVVRVLCVLWTCVALSASGELYAQVRARAPNPLGAAISSGAQDAPGIEGMRGANPCLRWSVEPQEPAIKLYKTAWITICIEKVRSDAVALAWAQELDEHGMQLDADARARKLAEMEAWLRRLVGKFRIEGERWNTGRRNLQVSGTAECFGIGSGPGVSCVISAAWKAGKGTDSALRPQVLLFGLDPGAMEIRVTHVDSLAAGMRGFLLDDAVIVEAQSPPEISTVNPALVGVASNPVGRVAPQSLSRDIPKPLSRVAIKPGGDVDMKFHVYRSVGLFSQPVEFDLQLHREPQVDTVRSVEPDPVLAANFTCAKPADPGGLEEPKAAPGGVRESSVEEMQAWLGLLAGRYTYGGCVDLRGKGDPEDQRPVTGEADCIAAGSPPSVHCKVNVSWPAATRENGAPVPGGVSNLAPAQFLFSIESSPRWGLVLMQLDNRGIAEWASGELVGDTFTSREPCVDIPRSCQKITRITARPDSNEISMLVDIEVDRQRVLRQAFLLHRESNLRNGKPSAGPSP